MKANHKKIHRVGAKLSDGAAHEADHSTWTRRSFLELAGLGGIATGVMAAGIPMNVFGQHAFFQSPSVLDNDRVVVIIRLNGGNDGLNTVIPFNDDLYYQKRPNIAIAKNDTLSVSGDYGFHPVMTGFKDLWDRDELSFMLNVGYPDRNGSHAVSGQIWERGDREFTSSGWAARYIETVNPNIYGEAPEHPVLTQVGSSNALFFNGSLGKLGFGIPNQRVLDRLAEEGVLYNQEDVPDNRWGEKLSMVRRVANSASSYSRVIGDILSAQGNSVEYPDTSLGNHLSSIAKMIKGGMSTKMYLVRVGGWDTHANQINRHIDLLTNLGSAMKAFQDDLNATGHNERVLTMTVSEFGRRVHENGSMGTDHGEAAPLFVMGSSVLPGILGGAPDLSGNNVPYQMDFRTIYGTILEHWMGVSNGNVGEIMNGSFEYQPFVDYNPVEDDPGGGDPPAPTNTEREGTPDGFVLAQNYPNPFNPTTNISFELPATSYVSLRVFDLRGRLVETLVSRTLAAGSHSIAFDASNLASGMYLYRLETPSVVRTRKMTLLR